MSEMPQLSPPQAVFHKVAQNLYRLESSGTYYALFKRSGKQIRRSLKTTDPVLARRRLGQLGNKVARLNHVAEVTVPSLADWEKDWKENSERSTQPKLAPVFLSPLVAVVQSN